MFNTDVHHPPGLIDELVLEAARHANPRSADAAQVEKSRLTPPTAFEILQLVRIAKGFRAQEILLPIAKVYEREAARITQELDKLRAMNNLLTVAQRAAIGNERDYYD